MYIDNAHQHNYVTTEDHLNFSHHIEHSPARC